MYEEQECNVEDKDKPGYQDNIPHLGPLNLLSLDPTLVTAVFLFEISWSTADPTMPMLGNSGGFFTLILRQT